MIYAQSETSGQIARPDSSLGVLCVAKDHTFFERTAKTGHIAHKHRLIRVLTFYIISYIFINFTYSKPGGHMTFIQRRINVDATS